MQGCNYIAVYGTLRPSCLADDAPLFIEKHLSYMGSCVIKGILYNIGYYPGLTPGEGKVVGDLFEIKDTAIFKELDIFERYNPDDISHSGFIRKVIPLLHPKGIEAWVYYYNESIEGKQQIIHGDWEKHVRND